MTTSADTSGVVRPHTSRQLQALGRHYGIDYRFPELHKRRHGAAWAGSGALPGGRLVASLLGGAWFMWGLRRL